MLRVFEVWIEDVCDVLRSEAHAARKYIDSPRD